MSIIQESGLRKFGTVLKLDDFKRSRDRRRLRLDAFAYCAIDSSKPAMLLLTTRWYGIVFDTYLRRETQKIISQSGLESVDTATLTLRGAAHVPTTRVYSRSWGFRRQIGLSTSTTWTLTDCFFIFQATVGH